MIENIKAFCRSVHIDVTDEEIEAQIPEWRDKLFDDIILELVPMIQEQAKTFSQKLLQKKEKEQKELERQKFIETQSNTLNELKETKEQLLKELKEIEEKMCSIQRKIHSTQIEWKKKQEISPHMEVKNFLTEWEKQGKPEIMEYVMSPDAVAIIKDMNIKISKPSQRGKQISVEFAESPRPQQFQQEVHENPDFEERDQSLYLIPKSNITVELGEPQKKITAKIDENLKKNRHFVSVVRGPFVTATVDALPFPVHGVIVTRNTKGDLTSMSTQTFARKQEKSPFPILNCCVISYSSDTINEFVINLKANQISDKTYNLIEENLTIQKRD